MVAGSIALVSGYADVISLHRWKCFSGMLTGNTIWFGRVLAGETNPNLHGPLFYFSIILVFFFGVALHRWADMRWKHRGASTVGSALGFLGLVVEIWMHSVGHELLEFEVAKWAVLFYVPIFGVVNGASMDGRLGSATTMITGHVTKLGQALASWGTQEYSYVEKCKLVMSFIIFAASIVGASLGVLVLRQSFFNTAGAFLPVLPTLIVLLFLHDHLARPRKRLQRFAKEAAKKAKKAYRHGGASQGEQQGPESSQELSDDESCESESDDGEAGQGADPFADSDDEEDPREAKVAGRGDAKAAASAIAASATTELPAVVQV